MRLAYRIEYAWKFEGFTARYIHECDENHINEIIKQIVSSGFEIENIICYDADTGEVYAGI